MGKFSTGLKEKCPRCGQGELFTHHSYLPFSKKTFQMKKYCPECGLKYEKELGYFYGSMYVSYALNIGLFAICLLSYLFLFKDRFGWEYFAVAYLLITFLLTGVIFRWARALWLAALTRYEPGIRDERNLQLLETEPNIGK